MSQKTINVCDGCKKELPRKQDSYKLCLQTERFWNGVESDWFTKNLEFCEGCARRILVALEKIATKQEAKA